MDAAKQRALVEAAKGGSDDAWESLYRGVYPRLYAYVARRCGREDAEDLVNETMTRAVGAIDRFRWEPAGFDAWLFGIARRVTASHNRASSRARRSHGEEELGPSAHGIPGEALEIRDDHAQLRAAFARLGAPERELLELRFIAGLSVEDTASVVGKRAGAVRTAQSRALARLREMMREVE